MKGAVENCFKLNGKEFLVSLFRTREELVTSIFTLNMDIYAEPAPAELIEAVTKKQGRPFRLIKMDDMEFAGYPEKGNHNEGCS